MNLEETIEAITKAFIKDARGRFTASDVYLGIEDIPDLTMYAALDALVARGELEECWEGDARTHDDMIYRIKNKEVV